MKRIICIITILNVSFYLPAQNTGNITLTNLEDDWFYFFIDPQGLSVYDTGNTLFQEDVKQFFSKDRDDVTFISLAPGSTQTIQGLAAGNHLILGFFIASSDFQYPIWFNTIKVESGKESIYTVKKQVNPILVQKGEGVLSDLGVDDDSAGSAPIAIDNRYEDWENIPILASFSLNFNPVYYSKEEGGKAEQLSVTNSQYWGRGGTQLQVIKAFYSVNYLYMYFSTQSRFARGFSIFLYLFEERQKGVVNSFTIELLADDTTNDGMVLLWEKGKDEPIDIGILKHASFYMELYIDLLKLPKSVLNYLMDKYSFDLTSCYFDSSQKTYEEFFFTTLYFKDIVNINDL